MKQTKHTSDTFQNANHMSEFSHFIGWRHRIYFSMVIFKQSKVAYIDKFYIEKIVF